MAGEFLRKAGRTVAGLIIVSGITVGAEAIINAQASSTTPESTRQSLSSPELKPLLTDYTIHGRVDVSTYGPEYQAHLRAITLSDKAHGTTAVFPDLHWGGPGFGAFVTAPDGNGPLYYSSLKDFPGAVLETVFASSHDGKMYVAIDSSARGPVMIYESDNGGVDWTDTGKSFAFTIDNPNDAYAPHRDTMRKNFETAIGGLAAVSKFAVPGLQ